MRPTTLFLKLALAALLGTACAAASASNPSNDIVVNGSFQDNNIGNAPWAYLSSVVGWTSTGPFEIEKGNNAGGWSSFNPADNGNQYLELDSTELTTISQDLHTSKGTTYDLSFQYSGRSDTPGQAASEMAVYWNGKQIAVITEPAKSGWVTFNFDNLVATGKNTDLSFAALGPTSAPSYGNYLDNVVVRNVPAVPEAGSFAMLAAGLAFVTYSVRRRRQ
jgi:hypothetical protein